MLSRCQSFPVPPSAAILRASQHPVLIPVLDFNESIQELLKSLPLLPDRRVASLKDESSAPVQGLQLEWQRMSAVTLLTCHGEGSVWENPKGQPRTRNGREIRTLKGHELNSAPGGRQTRAGIKKRQLIALVPAQCPLMSSLQPQGKATQNRFVGFFFFSRAPRR